MLHDWGEPQASPTVTLKLFSSSWRLFEQKLRSPFCTEMIRPDRAYTAHSVPRLPEQHGLARYATIRSLQVEWTSHAYMRCMKHGRDRSRKRARTQWARMPLILQRNLKLLGGFIGNGEPPPPPLCTRLKKESLLEQNSPALQPLPLAFRQLLRVPWWPHHLAETTVGVNITLSLNQCVLIYVLCSLTSETCGRKEKKMALHLLSGSAQPSSVSKNWWWKSPQALRHERHESENFLREDVRNAYDRAVGHAKVRSVSLTNGKKPALPELTWPRKTMREEWRISPAYIRTARRQNAFEHLIRIFRFLVIQFRCGKRQDTISDKRGIHNTRLTRHNRCG